MLFIVMEYVIMHGFSHFADFLPSMLQVNLLYLKKLFMPIMIFLVCGREEGVVLFYWFIFFILLEPEWNYISDTAKDFIRNLLVLEPSKRLTVEQCLAHPFLAGSAGTQMLNIEKSMSKYNVQRKKAKHQVDEK